jgi:hypothetical protein
MPAPIKKLSDRFAGYDLSIKCRKCGHVRATEPHALAKILGWEATIESVAARLTFSKCQARSQCELTPQVQRRPRGCRTLALVGVSTRNAQPGLPQPGLGCLMTKLLAGAITALRQHLSGASRHRPCAD